MTTKRRIYQKDSIDSILTNVLDRVACLETKMGMLKKLMILLIVLVITDISGNEVIFKTVASWMKL